MTNFVRFFYVIFAFVFMIGLFSLPSIYAQFPDPNWPGQGGNDTIPIQLTPQLFSPYQLVGSTMNGGPVNKNLGVSIGAPYLYGKLGVYNSQGTVSDGIYLHQRHRPENNVSRSRAMFTDMVMDDFEGQIYGNELKIFRGSPNGGPTVGYLSNITNVGSSNAATRGIQSLVNAVHDSYGGYFYVISGGSVEGTAADIYGIYVEAWGLSANSTTFSGYFNGAVRASQFIQPSDRKLKRNIQTASSSLDKVLGLNVYTYDYAQEAFPHMIFPEGQQTGFLAQEIEKNFPHLVQKAVHPEVDTMAVPNREYHPEVDYKGVDYTGMIPHLTKAIQEQQEMIQALQEEIQELRASIASVPTSEAESEPDFQLFQNIPNPAYGETNIAVHMGDSYHTASIVIREIKTGRLQAKISIHDMGRVEVPIQTNGYPAGLYAYSLEVDGKIIDSHTMVIQ